MLVLESYKPFAVDSQEVVMTRANQDFERAGAATERNELWRERAPRKSAPADQLMYAWSIKASEIEKDQTPVERHFDTCPPEVYIG